MKSILYATAFLAACVCLFSGATFAQSTVPPAPPAPVQCNATQSVPIDMTKFQGIWYEVARNPAPPTSMSCVAVNVFQNNTNQLWINTTFAHNSQTLNSNRTITANVTLIPGTGFNLTYHSSLTGISGLQPNITMKVLNTDYTSFALVCGYTTSSDMNTSFGLVLTRGRFPGSALAAYKEMAALSYSNFAANMPNITQSKECYSTNGASNRVPVLATLTALLFVFFKFIN